MKKIILLVPFFLLFSCSKIEKNFKKLIHNHSDIPKVSEEFVQGSEDIPLLAGMEKISDGAIGFDSATGSIVASSYLTYLERNKIKSFYVRTLPQMGWRLSTFTANIVNFERDKEDLEIEITEKDSGQIVRFFISSQSE